MRRTLSGSWSSQQNNNWEFNRQQFFILSSSYPLSHSSHYSGIRLVFNHPCWPEEHWRTIKTSQSGTCGSTSRKISWFQMGEVVSSQRSIWSTEKIATFADWIIPCKYTLRISRFTQSNSHQFVCFKGEELVVNARKEADLINPATQQYLELDLFLPSLHLAFEHQVFIPYSSLKSKYWTESMNNTKG